MALQKGHNGPRTDRGGPKERPKAQTAFVFASMIGHDVTVQVHGGKVFTGLFHGCQMEKDYSISLHHAQEQPANEGDVTGEVIPSLIIPGRELVLITADKVPMDGTVERSSGAFSTDRDIRRAQNGPAPDGKPRDLTMWEADGNENPAFELGSAESSAKWDQFEANKKLFGVNTTYQEEMYTTRLDTSKLSREQKERADRVAREIERDGVTTRIEEEEGEAAQAAVVGTGAFQYSRAPYQGKPDNSRANMDDNWRSGSAKGYPDQNAKGYPEQNGQNVDWERRHPQFAKANREDVAADDNHGTALLAPWTKSINALNLESTMAVPRKDRVAPTAAPKAHVRATRMPPPPKTPKVEKKDGGLNPKAQAFNPAAKAFTPGGVLHLAVSPGGSLQGSVKENGSGSFPARTRERSFQPPQLVDHRTMHQCCAQLLEVATTAGDSEAHQWPEAKGPPISAIFGSPTVTLEQLNRWLLQHANRQPGQQAGGYSGQQMYMAGAQMMHPQQMQTMQYGMQQQHGHGLEASQGEYAEQGMQQMRAPMMGQGGPQQMEQGMHPPHMQGAQMMQPGAQPGHMPMQGGQHGMPMQQQHTPQQMQSQQGQPMQPMQGQQMQGPQGQQMQMVPMVPQMQGQMQGMPMHGQMQGMQGQQQQYAPVFVVTNMGGYPQGMQNQGWMVDPQQMQGQGMQMQGQGGGQGGHGGYQQQQQQWQGHGQGQ